MEMELLYARRRLMFVVTAALRIQECEYVTWWNYGLGLGLDRLRRSKLRFELSCLSLECCCLVNVKDLG